MARQKNVSNDRFAAFIEYGADDCALVTVHPRKGDGIDFSDIAACYETLGNGATESARREIARLARGAAA